MRIKFMQEYEVYWLHQTVEQVFDLHYTQIQKHTRQMKSNKTTE